MHSSTGPIFSGLRSVFLSSPSLIFRARCGQQMRVTCYRLKSKSVASGRYNCRARRMGTPSDARRYAPASSSSRCAQASLTSPRRACSSSSEARYRAPTRHSSIPPNDLGAMSRSSLRLSRRPSLRHRQARRHAQARRHSLEVILCQPDLHHQLADAQRREQRLQVAALEKGPPPPQCAVTEGFEGSRPQRHRPMA